MSPPMRCAAGGAGELLAGFRQAAGRALRRALLLLLEPDFGAAVVLLATGTVVLFLAGARWRDFLGIAALGICALALLALSSDYRCAA
jgi:cell division protein FtsW